MLAAWWDGVVGRPRFCRFGGDACGGSGFSNFASPLAVEAPDAHRGNIKPGFLREDAPGGHPTKRAILLPNLQPMFLG